MKNILSKALLGFALLFSVNAVATVALPSGGVHAENADGIPIDEERKTAEVNSINGTLQKLAKTVAWIVVGVATLVIVYAGFKYATSQGEPKQTEQAKHQIFAAGMGLIIALGAITILNVFTEVLGAGGDGN